MLLLAACADDGEDSDAAGDDAETADASDDDSSDDDSGDGGDGGGESFYGPDDTLEMIIPSGAGGGTDTIGRTVAPILAEKLGVDSIEVRNAPGGGGILGANEYVSATEHDGQTLVMYSSGVTMAGVLQQSQIEYELQDFHVLAGYPGGNIWTSHADGPIQEGVDMAGPTQTEPVTYHGQSPNGVELRNVLILELLETDVNIVLGHESSQDARLAWETKEGDITGHSAAAYFSQIEPLVEEGAVLEILTGGFPTEGGLERDPAWPDIPHIGEVYEESFGEPIESKGPPWEAFELLNDATIPSEKTLAVHADAPAQAIEELEAAVDEMVAESDYQQEIAELIGGYDTLVGSDLVSVWDGLIEKTDGASEGREWLFEWAEEEWDFSFE